MIQFETWWDIFLFFTRLLQVDSAAFIHCKEIVDEYLHSLEFALPTNSVYILDGAQIQQQLTWSPSLRHRLARRGRSEPGDLDDYYDGFRRLYSEEANPEQDIERLIDSERKRVSPCPPLHPAVN